MKLLCIHAHFDDFEFVAGGTFDQFRRKYGAELATKLIVCTDGAAGHHERGLEETRKMRWEEQKAAAEIGGHEVERLRMPDGTLRCEANPDVDRPFLAALWRAIREFEPDYLFCPPLPQDPLVGVHVDHVAVAEAVRKVAYMINVPHAYLDIFPELEKPPVPCKVPVILNTYDAYMLGANACDFLVNVEESFDRICEMAWCHQSQIREWLPWVGRHRMPVPESFDDWKTVLRDRFRRQANDLGLNEQVAVEAFTVTAWGEIPTLDQIKNEFPNLVAEKSGMANLKRWERFDQ